MELSNRTIQGNIKTDFLLWVKHSRITQTFLVYQKHPAQKVSIFCIWPTIHKGFSIDWATQYFPRETTPQLFFNVYMYIYICLHVVRWKNYNVILISSMFNGMTH